jgi:hypothetical protein
VAADDSTTVASMIEELLGNSSLLWLLGDTGEIVLREWAWSAPVATGISQSVKRTATYRPVATRKLGYRRNERVMARGDLAAIVLATEVAYLDGTPIESLKPAEAGATLGAPAGTPVAGMPAEDVIAEQARGAGTDRGDLRHAGAAGLRRWQDFRRRAAGQRRRRQRGDGARPG